MPAGSPTVSATRFAPPPVVRRSMAPFWPGRPETAASTGASATSLARVAGPVLVAAALALFAYRFANVDLASFTRDEPQFLAAAREQPRSGQWLQANPL